MTKYQKYQLQWMIDHDKSIDDLICKINTHREDCDPADDLLEVFWSWEQDAGFGGEIWACEAEWRECEGMEPTIESKFTGKSGYEITIQRHGVDDYEADWENDFSVRGTLKQIMEEVKEDAKMETTERMNANYRIINAVRLDNRTELVIGHNPKAPSPYVCWYCYNGNDYNCGDYCTSFRGAMQSMGVRIMRNLDFMPMDLEV